MNEQSGAIGDMITLVAGGQQAEATPVLHDLLGARIMDALQSHKQEIAQTLFAPGTDALAEESEQLDELSRATLGSYIQSRTHDLRSSGAAWGARGQWPKETKDRAEAISVAKKEGDKIQAGIKLAAKKLSKEESEQLNEISKATALSVSDKRNKKGQALFNASTRSSDPLTKKVLGNRSITMFTKANKAENYAHKKKD